jgi:hypothetical protein
MKPRHCKKGCKNTKRAGTSSVKARIPIVRKKEKPSELKHLSS